MDRTERTRLRAMHAKIGALRFEEPDTVVSYDGGEVCALGFFVSTHAALIVGAVNALPALLAALDAAEALRPRDPHRTGHRCACCGREGAPEADGLCPYCREAHATERERDALRFALDARNDTLAAMRVRATESAAACAAAEHEGDDARAEVETLRAEAALLREKLAAATTRVEELEESTAMACQSPADGCDCAGCLYAAERGGES